MKVYIDGTLYDREHATIPVFDHGLLYGDGVFEGLRIYNGKVFKLHEHLKRLFESCKGIALESPLSEESMAAAVHQTVSANGQTNGYVRLVITRGDGPLGIDPTSCKPRVIIIVGDIQLYPQEYYTRGIGIITSSYRRIPAACFDVRIKSLNYLNNVLAKIEAKRAGFLEAVMLNVEDRVAECTGDNIFIIKDGTLITPPVTEGALQGITRGTVLTLARMAQIPVCESFLTRFDLYTADECFLTGTAAEIIPVIEIDSRRIGDGTPGAWTKKIISLFKESVCSSD
jgi:branched-chain amino acid aminotransferase